MAESGEQFLHRKDTKLHTTGPVEHERARKRSAGEAVSQRPADKIADWLGVIERTRMGHKDDPRVIDRIKDYYHREYVIKPENIPQSYWDLQGEIAVNEGRKQDLIEAGVLIEEVTGTVQDGKETKKRSYTFPDDLKEEATRTIISSQQQSLDGWIDYLTQDDAPYPMWAKYWVFRSIVKMGKLEKAEDGKARFAAREKNTVSSFPVLNQRALANTIGAMSAQLEERGKPRGERKPVENLSATLSDDEYQKLLSTEGFSKLYAQFLSEIPEYSTHGLEQTQGRWIKYAQGSDPKPLVRSLEGHPLEWCTADLDTARRQLEGGDFYVYYSMDKEGNPIIPRLAIRMEGSKIAEPPRGIAPNQNLDPYISDVLEKKLGEFGSEGRAFKKRTADMKRLTAIEQKTQKGQPLDASDLVFLYEMDSQIKGFGYDKDPRIEELGSQRNPDKDMPIVFGCTPDQIAHRASEIRPDTKAYVGPLEKGIFNKLTGIEYVYTSFPEGRIRIEPLEIGGRDFKASFVELAENLNIKNELIWKRAGKIVEQARTGSIQISRNTLELLSQLADKQINIYGYALDMLKSDGFTSYPNTQDLWTVRLKVQDLAKGTPTTDEVFARANALGLDPCPAEVGPHLRLKDTNQPLEEEYYIGMKQIADRRGRPSVFSLERDEDGLWLYNKWADPDSPRYPYHEFVFSLRKENETQTLKTPGFLDRLFRR